MVPNLREIQVAQARLYSILGNGEMAEDHGHVGLTLRSHPLSFLSADLGRGRIVTCRKAMQASDGTWLSRLRGPCACSLAARFEPHSRSVGRENEASPTRVQISYFLLAHAVVCGRGGGGGALASSSIKSASGRIFSFWLASSRHDIYLSR